MASNALSMHSRLLVFAALSCAHAVLGVLAPAPLAPVIGGSLYIVLMPLALLGFPVLALPESGGWSAPTLLGWIAVAFVWLIVWWFVASAISRLVFHKPRRTHG